MIAIFELPILFISNFEEIENAKEGDIVKEEYQTCNTFFRVDLDKVAILTIQQYEDRCNLHINDDIWMVDSEYYAVKALLSEYL